jgi:hypothetical protein
MNFDTKAIMNFAKTHMSIICAVIAIALGGCAAFKNAMGGLPAPAYEVGPNERKVLSVIDGADATAGVAGIAATIPGAAAVAVPASAAAGVYADELRAQVVSLRADFAALQAGINRIADSKLTTAKGVEEREVIERERADQLAEAAKERERTMWMSLGAAALGVFGLRGRKAATP